jgi:Metallo-beta-lactamase superfamily
MKQGRLLRACVLVLLGCMLLVSALASGEGPIPGHDDSLDEAIVTPNEDSTTTDTNTEPPSFETDPPSSETDPPIVDTIPPSSDTTVDGNINGTVSELLDRMVAAIGGEDALRKMRFLQVMATGETMIDYQGPIPQDRVDGAAYERNYTIDLFLGKVRLDEFTMHKFEVFQSFPASITTRKMQRQIGEQIGPKLFVPEGTMPSTSVAALSRQLAFQNPHILLIYLIADDRSSNITNDGLDDNGNTVLVVPDPDGVSPIRFTINAASGLVNKVSFRESHPLVGDRRVIYRYFNWDIQSEGDVSLLFPRRVRISSNQDKVLWDERRIAVMTPSSVDETMFTFSENMDEDSFDEFSFVYGLSNALMFETYDMVGFSLPWVTPYGNITELTTGVTLMISQGSYNNLVLEHPGGLIMMEAFGSQYQSREFLANVKDLFPGQNITHLLQSHHHFDFSSGVRQIMGEGDVVLVVGDGIQGFWEEVLKADNSIMPDSIELSGETEFNIESLSMDEVRVLLETDAMVVTAYATSLFPHADDTLIFTIDADGRRFLFEADLYNAGLGLTVALDGPPALFNAMRYHEIISSDCTSDVPLTIVPVRGVPLTLEESLAELASLEIDVGCP